jgi:hypothetical protein
MLEEAYGKATMKKTQVSAWHKRFHDGSARVYDDSLCGGPSASTNELRSTVRIDCGRSTQDILKEERISVEGVALFFTKILTCIALVKS